MTHKQVIVLRKDLNMRKGKMVAQGAHASLAAILNLGYPQEAGPDERLPNWVIPLDHRLEPWIVGKFKKICVYVTSEAELWDLNTKARERGIIHAMIQDSGLTEFGGVPTYTAIAIGPDLDEVVDELTGHLKLL